MIIKIIKEQEYHTIEINTTANMITSTSAVPSRGLFNNQMISDLENGSVSETHHPIVGELVFGKFIKEEDTDASPLLLDDTVPSTASSLKSAVDDFFLNDDNSTPMFEFDAINTSTQWTSLFDNDIPITQKDVQLANELSVEIEQDEVQREPQATLEIGQTSYLPTPTIEEGKLIKPSSLSKPSQHDKVSKVDHLGVISYNRKNRSVPLSPIFTESGDPVAAKRARNTEAARRSRARKLMRMNQLEDKVEELLNRNSQLEDEVKRLTSLLNK